VDLFRPAFSGTGFEECLAKYKKCFSDRKRIPDNLRGVLLKSIGYRLKVEEIKRCVAEPSGLGQE